MSTSMARGSERPLSVLLIHMPMADPVLPNLGVELLAEVLRHSGVGCDVLYGTLLLPPSVSLELMHGMAGQVVFTPHYFGIDVDGFVRDATRALGVEVSEEAAVERELHTGIAAAEICLERCLSAIDVGKYALVGFSVIFDTQKLPSATLARHLVAREPELPVLFGGTGCDGVMAPAILEHFPEVDAVVSGDAEQSIVEVVRFLAAGGHRAGLPAPVPNLILRPRGKSLRVIQAGMVRSLEERHTPSYASFITQVASSAHAARMRLTLLFEASRGCWWGDKHHCTFCGIRTVSEGYRERSAERVQAEILELHERYSPSLLYATDAILSRQHMRQVLPSLAQHRREQGSGPKLFFEIKSNASRRDVALLAAAGVVAVQPGIESFSSAMLARVDKGAIGIRQIETLKWLRAYDIDTIYGLMVGTPGETAAELREMLEILPLLHHLQPPVGVNRLGLHRFSPYFQAPERHGLRDVRPHRLQEVAYRGPRERLMRLCYELDYTSNETENGELQALHTALRGAVSTWRRAFATNEHLMLSETQEGTMVIRRSGARIEPMLLDRAESAVYRAIHQVASLSKISREAGLGDASAEQALRRLRERGLALHLDGAWLGLAVPVHIDAFIDAGLARSARTAQSAEASV
jgi:ribosomal peptide maturation radical SAM protein 1